MPSYVQLHKCKSMIKHTFHQYHHFISLQLASLHFISLRFSLLHLVSLHFTKFLCTSFHFTALQYSSLPNFHFPALLKFRRHTSKPLHFSIFIITFLTLYLIICDLQWIVSSTSAGSWFHSLYVLFTKQYNQ